MIGPDLVASAEEHCHLRDQSMHIRALAVRSLLTVLAMVGSAARGGGTG